MSGPIDVAAMINAGRDVPRWRRIALPASILLNLFLVAVIGGHMWRVRGHEAAFATPMARVLARAEASLPAQDAAKFGAVIRRDAQRYADAQKRLLDARLELRRQITADQFNQEDVRRALATWQAAWNAFFDDFGNTLVEALAQVSPDGRHKLAAAHRLEGATASQP